jgi:hypothetical protein
MEPSTTIRKMLAGNRFCVPAYQRPYAWDTTGKERPVIFFFSDLTDHIDSSTRAPYSFGHFLFETKSGNEYRVIDGQQRLTTIVIFLSALFRRLEALRPLTAEEAEARGDMIKQGSTYRFETVDYDDPLFKAYVIDRSKTDQNGLQTDSAKRMVKAYDYFRDMLRSMDENELLQLLQIVSDASCTTCPVSHESESVQMFVFQNYRGKKLTHMEILKALFLYHAHLHGGEEKDALIKEIKDRTESIYKAIFTIQYKIDEDDVLLYASKVYFNSLQGEDMIERINKIVKTDPIPFIRKFMPFLAASFGYLAQFFNEDEPQCMEIHSLVSLGGIAVALPFVIKAYAFGLPIEEKARLCASFESILLRHRLIARGADLAWRIEEVFRQFTKESPDVQPIIHRINEMKSANFGGKFWCNAELERVLQGQIRPDNAKFLLWKYENHLRSQKPDPSFSFPFPLRFDSVRKYHLEHIAPKTENKEPVAAGFEPLLDKDFIECLGNYLLLTPPDNIAIGNKSFPDIKRPAYTELLQQRKIREMTENDAFWDKTKIAARKEKIIQFIMGTI